MASSPKLRAIPPDAVQDADEWFRGPVLGLLNSYLTDAGNAFDYLLGANTRRQVETFVATTTAAGALRERSFKIRLPNKPVELRLSAFPTSTSSSRTFDLGTPVWSLNQGGEVTLHHVPGLVASTEYRFTVILES